MKKIFKTILLAFLCISSFACKANVEVQNAVIPSNKTGVVISNPFKDDSKFESRAITYYTKYDVEHYQISVWCKDALGDKAQTSENTVASLKITKDDSYTAKTLTFDTEGTYVFKCEAYTTGNELIAEDSVTKKLTFANAEFIIFYLIPKIKTQTADVSATIKWAGDDDTKVAHVVRIVRPFDNIDVSINVLQNGKCSYNADGLVPILINSNLNPNAQNTYKLSTVKLSECDVTSMVGKVGESYSFSLQIKVKTDDSHHPNDYWGSGNVLSWMRSYNENNEVVNDSFNEDFYYWRDLKSACWVLLDGKIYRSMGSVENMMVEYNCNNLDMLPQTEKEIKDNYYAIDTKGNVITLGDYVSSVYGWTASPGTIAGATLMLADVPESAYSNNIFKPTVPSTDQNNDRISVCFNPIVTPYLFKK